MTLFHERYWELPFVFYPLSCQVRAPPKSSSATSPRWRLEPEEIHAAVGTEGQARQIGRAALLGDCADMPSPPVRRQPLKEPRSNVVEFPPRSESGAFWVIVSQWIQWTREPPIRRRPRDPPRNLTERFRHGSPDFFRTGRPSRPPGWLKPWAERTMARLLIAPRQGRRGGTMPWATS